MHPNRKNIDQKVNLPEGINFREDVIWDQVKRPKKNKKPIFWWVAASVIFGLLGIAAFLFNLEKREGVKENFLLTEISSIDPELGQVSLKSITEKPAIKAEENKGKVIQQKVKENKEVTLHLISETVDVFANDKSVAEISDQNAKILESTEIQTKKEEQTLSPAAQRLQASLDKVNPKSEFKEKIILQRMTLAEFLGANRNLDLAKGKNINQESVLSTLIRGSYEKN